MAEPNPLTLKDLETFLDGEIFQHAAKIYQDYFLEVDERVLPARVNDGR